MNSLSWMLYAAGAIGALNTLLFVTAVAAGILAAFGLICSICVASESRESLDDRFAKLWMRISRTAFITLVVVAPLLAIIPTSQTVYLIIASEVTGKTASSVEGQEILSEMRQTITDLLKKMRGESKK